MLGFFRKYQKFFFLFTTIIIVCSFVFFGTYQALAPTRQVEDETAFRTLDGKVIHRSYLTNMAKFLSSEVSARGPGANFLNDGVISKDFLKTGMAYPLLDEPAKEELASRSLREKNYRGYIHPHAPTLSANQVWSLFAPDIQKNLTNLQSFDSLTTQEAFDARVELYLAESKFPPQMLSQVLRYQENQYPQMPRDFRLMRDNLAIFGYRDLTEWFGSHFLESVCRFIIQSATIARQKGYTVTRDEVLAELLYASEKTYHAVKDQLRHPVANGYEFYQQFLRQMQIDESSVLKIWEDVLLFRRLFEDVGSAALVDPLAIAHFSSFANENATIELFELPQELRFKSIDDLKKFEVYLQAISPEGRPLLGMPKEYAPIETVEERAPYLVGKRFTLELAKITQTQLQSKVSLKESWEWELEGANWEKIQSHFPEIASQTAQTREERFAILEKLDEKGRNRVDQFAREQIVESHPEWIETTLAELPGEEKKFCLRSLHKKSPLEGIDDVAALCTQLEENDILNGYTQDNKTTYRIVVKSRPESKEILSFAEALKEGALQEVEFDTTDLFDAIQEDGLAHGLIKESIPTEKLAETIIPYRFAYHFRKERDRETLFNLNFGLSSSNSEGFTSQISGFFSKAIAEGAIAEEKSTRDASKVPEGEGEKPEVQVFKPRKKLETLTRAGDHLIALDETLTLETDSFSEVKVSAKEGAYFYRLLDRKADKTLPMDKLLQTQELLSAEAKLHFMDEVLKKIEAEPCLKN